MFSCPRSHYPCLLAAHPPPFCSRMSTHAVNIFRKNVVDNDGKTIRGDIWDTAGQDKFASMHPSYYYKADACILVFDTTRKETYVNLTKWYTELRRNCPKIPCIVVANKIDINYMVTQKRFKFANKHSLPFFFCSSADGTNVVKVFNDVIMAGLQNKKHAAKDFVDECLEAFDTLFEDEEKGQSEN
mmetsp:Transcript_33582/g.67786  ORF Transcript_33582/g.67786 Transcript_33582/m.67786 type:complete len:186 (+) Transcript_33582:263-820(+)